MKRISPRGTRRSGFTLIELLVVIAIIAILAAILFPVFAQAREKAREATCMSNNKQIGLGLIQYVQDFDETLPSRYFPANIGPGCTTSTFTNLFDVPGKPSLLSPYLKSTDVFKCPDNLANPIKQSGNYNFAYGYNVYLSATAYNSYADCTQVKAPNQVIMAKIQNPSSVIMFGDDSWGARTLYAPSQGRAVWGQNFCNPVQTSDAAMVDIKTSPGGNFPIGRHMRGTIMGFTDGHVKFLPDLEQVYNNGDDSKFYALNATN